MGRRPRFCPPLLSSRGAGAVAAPSSRPRTDGEAAVMARLPPPGQAASSPASSNTPATSSSPRLVAEPSSPSQGRLYSQEREQRSKKRKSPQVIMPILRSPLSRIMLSPSMQLRMSPRVRSPSIDLNVALEQEEEIQGNVRQRAARRRDASNEVRRRVFDTLLAMARNGELKGHETGEVSVQYSLSVRTVQKIWQKGKACLDQGLPVDVSSGKKRCGRKKKLVDVSRLRDLPISERTTLEDVATHLSISKTKLHRMKKVGEIKRVSSSLKPLLTDQNKKDRLNWCLRMLDPRSIPHDPMFQGLFDYVYIDEKWFNITKNTLRYYTAPDEQQPVRTCKNKNYIPRIMILSACARQRFDSNGNCTFDGKIGCFPFVTYVAAKRSSANRPAGIIEMKSIDSVKQEVMRDFMINKVLPAIRAKWPREDIGKPIYIQQNNARPHVSPNDRLFCEATRKDGFNIRIVCQPANSPDLNILDLDFFNAIQSIQYKTIARTTEELVAAVDKAFEDFSVCKANRIFLTLHGCMQEIMRVGGGNEYNIPHIRKSMLERQKCLPLQLKCDATLVNDVMAQLE